MVGQALADFIPPDGTETTVSFFTASLVNTAGYIQHSRHSDVGFLLPLFIFSSYSSSSPEWKPAVYLAAIDCAENIEVCRDYGISGYPSIKVGGRVWTWLTVT